MSHFTVAVFTKENGKSVDELLAPYNENIEVAPYIKYTKEQAIEKVRKEIEDYKNTTFAEYLKDPIAYKEKCNNSAHFNYINIEFPKKLNWTDEECYEHEKVYFDENDIDEEGNLWSTYNPNSKWDWYSVGGRWAGMLKAKKGIHGDGSAFSDNPRKNGEYDSARVGDIDFPDDFSTFAVILPDGKWYENGQMGWWACVSNEDEDWEKKYKEKFIDKADPDWIITIVDCHI